MKKVIIVLDRMISETEKEKLRKNIAIQLKEGIVVLDCKVKDVMFVEDLQEIEIRGET